MLVTRVIGGQGWELQQGQALGIHGSGCPLGLEDGVMADTSGETGN